MRMMRKGFFIALAAILLILASCQEREASIPKETEEIIVVDREPVLPAERIMEEAVACDEACEKDNSIRALDASGCERVGNTKERNDCFFGIGVAKKDSGICLKISDLTLRNSCYGEIGYVEKKETARKSTFQETGATLCKEDGVPIVRAFGTSWCSHCRWAMPIFIKVAKDYEAKGLIKAYAWEINTADDLMTGGIEYMMPKEERDFYTGRNPKGIVPYFNLGCVYERKGTGFEADENGKALEEDEFRVLFDSLIAKLINE